MCQRYSDFRQLNVEILSIVNEDQSRCANLKAEYRAEFQFLADPEREVLKAYGVFHRTDPAGRPIPVPGAFLIDTDGIVRYSFVGENPSHRPDLDEIMAAISNISTTP